MAAPSPSPVCGGVTASWWWPTPCDRRRVYTSRAGQDDEVTVQYCGGGVYGGFVRDPYGYHAPPPRQVPSTTHASPAPRPRDTDADAHVRDDVARPRRGMSSSSKSGGGGGGGAHYAATSAYVLSPVCVYDNCLWQWRAVRCCSTRGRNDDDFSAHTTTSSTQTQSHAACYIVLPFLLLPCGMQHAAHPYIDADVLQRVAYGGPRPRQAATRPAHELLRVPSAAGDLWPVSRSALTPPPSPQSFAQQHRRVALATSTTTTTSMQRAAMWYATVLRTLHTPHANTHAHTTTRTTATTANAATAATPGTQAATSSAPLPPRDNDDNDTTTRAAHMQRSSSAARQATMALATDTNVHRGTDDTASDGAYVHVLVDNKHGDEATDMTAYVSAMTSIDINSTNTVTAASKGGMHDTDTAARQMPCNVICGGVAELALAIDRYAAMVIRKSCTLADACIAVLRDTPCPNVAMQLRAHALDIERELHAAVHARALLQPTHGGCHNTLRKKSHTLLTLDAYARLARWT